MSQVKGPFFVAPSRHGSVPNLTPDQARQILLPEERLLSVSLLDAQEFVTPCTASGMSLARFCGLADFTMIIPVRSSFHGVHASAPSSDKQLSGDHEKGRVSVTFPQWKATVDALHPDLCVAMHESLALSEPASRRRKTAQSRTDVWLGQTSVEPATTSNSTATVLYPFSSGHDESPVFIDALPRNETLLEYAASVQSVAADTPTLSFCVATSLPAYLAALASGVSMIECPVPWDLAASGIALTLFLQNSDASAHDGTALAEPQIDLNDSAFALDTRPVSDHCDCFTCQRHCRAYLHHLLTVQEMNSEILLAIHNLTQLVTLCRRCRTDTPAVKEHLLRRILLAQL